MVRYMDDNFRSVETPYQNEETHIAWYIKQMGNHRILDKKELSQKFKEFKIGGSISSRNDIINSHLRLAFKYAKNHYSNDFELIDLVQESNYGLFKGIYKFDDSLGYAMGTYLGWWCKQSLILYKARNKRSVYIPTYLVEESNKVRKTTRTLEKELNREPNDREIAEHMHISIEKLVKIQAHTQESISLNTELPNGSFLDLIENINAENPQKETELSDFAKQMDKLLFNLSESELRRLRAEYPEYGPKRGTRTVCKAFGECHESFRKNNIKTMKKLKPFANKQGLKYYLD